MMQLRSFGYAALALFVLPTFAWSDEPVPEPISPLKAGAAAIDITPPRFPVVVNGMFEERSADRALDKLYSRALVFDDGQERIAIVIVDSCVLPRSLCDAAKQLAAERAHIKVDRICIAATHTHSAPSAAGVLGSSADEAYVQFLIPQIARSIDAAAKNLQPAEIGFATVRDEQHTHCRRWIRSPGHLVGDPFGDSPAKAHMHPGHQDANAIGPSGPTDPDISILSVRSTDGKPITVLANYSMHYYGSGIVSSDYYGKFADALGKLMGYEDGNGTFVAMMSQGTSGDLYWADYDKPQQRADISEYSQMIAEEVFEAMKDLKYDRGINSKHPSSPIAMQEATLKLDRRVGNEKRTAWAKETLAKLGDRKPRSWPEIYAREQVLIAEDPVAELKLQAIRIGNVCIATWPNEVYALSGLKLKRQSPCVATFNIELANGSEGYIPPPEQHTLGGYTTWAARTAGLEVNAEPKIIDQLLSLLEATSGAKRRTGAVEPTSSAASILARKPAFFWPLNDFSGLQCADASGHNRPGDIEPKVVLFLSGDSPPGNASDSSLGARAFHFAGGRIKRKTPELGKTYTAEFRFWNGLPPKARDITGYLFSCGVEGDSSQSGDHLGIGGAAGGAGRLIFYNGKTSDEPLVGKTPLDLKTWYHVALVRDGDRVLVYLDGKPEIEGTAENTLSAENSSVFFGGRSDGFAPLEGKLNEAALYDRALTAEEWSQAPAQPATTQSETK